MGSLSKQKGNRYERTIANCYRAHGFEAKRGLQSRDGSDAADVVLQIPIWVECKHYKQGNWIFDAYAQALAAAPGGSLLVVHAHCDNGPHLVALSAFNYFRLLDAAAARLWPKRIGD